MSTPRHSEELDWSRWSAEWRVDRPRPDLAVEALRRTIDRGTLRLGALALGDVLLAALGVGVSFLLLEQWPDLVMRVWAVAVWLFTAVRLALIFTNRAGLWAARTATVAGFLDLQVRRSRAKLRTVVIVRSLLAAETLFLCPFAFWEVAAHPTRYADGWGSIVARYGTIAAFHLSILLWSIWFRRRARAELAWYEPLDRAANCREDP